MRTLHAIFASGLLAGALLAVSLSVPAANAESEKAFKDASAHFLNASSLIFACLSQARGGLAKQQLYDAIKELDSADNDYAVLRKLRAGKEFSAEDFVQQVNVIKRELGIDTAIKLEEEVIDFNQRELRALKKQIEGWKGNCDIPVKQKQEYLKLFNSKIRVERASQLAEIAFAQRLR